MLSVRRGLAAVMIVAAVSSVARAADSDALKPGMVLDQSNWQLADGLLPPEILKHYQEGGYSNKIVDFPLGSFNWPPDFKASTEKNAGQFKLSETGTVVLNSTGEQPPFILGCEVTIMRHAFVKIVGDQIEKIFLKIRARARNDLDLVLPDHLRKAQPQLRRRHRPRQRDHHLPAAIQMPSVSLSGVDQCRRIEVPIVVFYKFSHRLRHSKEL